MIKKRERFGSHLGLERIELLCAALDNPQDDSRFIHVAGTNGKGSVSAFLSSVLQASGYKVGLFTSPHLEHYRERFQINGECIEQTNLDALVITAERACLAVESEHPELGAITEFELATAVAFLFFQQAKVDLVVLETGLGGRLDATNVVKPVLSVITTIGHDHTERLGTSLQKIAWEKGGIIKPRVPVISGVAPGQAASLLQDLALKRQAAWYSINDLPWRILGWSLSGGQLSFPGWGQLDIKLLGEHQLYNAATALLALQQLNDLGWMISLDAVKRGLAQANWPGRLEIFSKEPFVLLDGSHNRQGIAALVKSLQHFQPALNNEPYTFVFGMLSNKEPSLLDPLMPLAKRFVFTAALSGRFAPFEPQELARYALSQNISASFFPNAADALEDALQSTPVCVCGSLYLVGTVKSLLRT